MTFKTLAIDTSTEAYSVACGDCDNINDIVEHFAVAPYKHSLLILDAVKKVLAECGWTLAQLDCIAFTHGPGSFTGLRLAASVVQGLAVAHNLPVIPISTLQTIAQGAYVEHKVEEVLVGIDARMHEIYWGAYNLAANGYMDCVGEDVLIDPNKVANPFPQNILSIDPISFDSKRGMSEANESMLDICEHRSRCATKASTQNAKSICGVGNAWEIYGTILQERSGVSTILTENRYPHARYVALLAVKYYRAGMTVTAAEALPLYLRDEVAHVA